MASFYAKYKRASLASFLFASSLSSLYFTRKDSCRHLFPRLHSHSLAQAWVKEEELKRLQNINTNVYVWGEGQQVDTSQDYTNYSPKNLKPFRGKDKPNVVDVAFGWYHEAYIDSKGKLYVCAKAKMTSVKIKEIDDKDRPDLQEVTTIPGQPRIRQVAFTRQRMFVLTEKGETYVFKIVEQLPQAEDTDHFRKGGMQVKGELLINEPIHIKDLKNIKMIACGSDHFLCLNSSGEVFAMGDDTFGQCGQGNDGRSSTAPFFEKRFGKPQLVKLDEKVVKIVCGYRHSLAITDKGNLFGWGYNNQQQLSHSVEYGSEENPWHAIYNPVQIKAQLEGKYVVDAAAGEEFSVVLVKNLSHNNVQELYATGNNLRGQLGINRLSHVQDMTLIEDVSGFVDQFKDRPLNISHIQCGRRHCVATFDYGAFFYWGDNEHGQLGDKKRRFLESPIPKSKFERRHNVENVICGIDSCAVIVEDLEDKLAKKKDSKKEPKRTITLAQMLTTPEDLKMFNEARLVKKQPDEEEPKKRLTERLREKIYGNSEKKNNQK